MSIRPTSDRILNGLSRQAAAGSFCFYPTADVSANCTDGPVSLPDAQLASLRRALELELGPDLSGIRVYIGSKAGYGSTDAGWVAHILGN